MSVQKSKAILSDDGSSCVVKGDMQFSYDHKFTFQAGSQPLVSYIKLIGNNIDTVYTFRWSMFLPVSDQWNNNSGPWNDYRLLVIFVPGMTPIVRHGSDFNTFDQMQYLDGSSLAPAKELILKYISDCKAERAVFEDDATKDSASARDNKSAS